MRSHLVHAREFWGVSWAFAPAYGNVMLQGVLQGYDASPAPVDAVMEVLMLADLSPDGIAAAQASALLQHPGMAAHAIMLPQGTPPAARCKSGCY